MARYETYTAVAPSLLLDDVKKEQATPKPLPYTIEVRFRGGLTDTQKAAFKFAADRWTRVIVSALPAVKIDDDVITGLLIFAEGKAIDGLSGVLGQAGATDTRPSSAGAAEYLPAKGRMMFDTADLERMEADGTLHDVISHEMGHVIGVSVLTWIHKELVVDLGSANPGFTGPLAMHEYARLRGRRKTVPVPIENTGGMGTRATHWRDSVFGNELMTSYIASSGNPLSRLTVAALKDVGYDVNFDAAEPYELPDTLLRAESGLLVPVDRGVMLPIIPSVLPDDSLV